MTCLTFCGGLPLTDSHEYASCCGCVVRCGPVRYQDKWLRGPFGPVQANLDHLLMMKPSARWQLAKNLFERQNEILRNKGKM